MVYYSKSRPIVPGGYPKTAPVKRIENYDKQTYIGLNIYAWGWIEYDGYISEKDASDYELEKYWDKQEFSA